MAEAVDSGLTPDKKRKVRSERGIEDYKRKIWKQKKELEELRESTAADRENALTKLREVIFFLCIVT